ncbi:hypothetical protein RhiirA5_422200 [Rhizophagus irregularis]|uniref:Uncharacterized protein n=1 Tax=Rhizophagus irregularis TaxID=588596 RepID=A0A2N0PCD2_9GLOM|nr:hypothetical protein RhiirA5_422200 [Rhizophagus irregularis]
MSCEVLLHLWNNGIHNVKELHRLTNIPKSTIYDNIKKLKENGTIKHAGGMTDPKRLPPCTWSICVEVSYRTVGRHLSSIGYRVEWAKKYINNQWDKTVFTDKTAFQIFRNTIERWYKGVRPVWCMPKDCVEVSYRTIGRHLSSIGYVKRLPNATPMLMTETHKKHR